MTNSDERGGSSDEETNETSLPSEPTVGWDSGTRSTEGELGEKVLGQDNILPIPPDLAKVSRSCIFMLKSRQSEIGGILHSAL